MSVRPIYMETILIMLLTEILLDDITSFSCNWQNYIHVEYTVTTHWSFVALLVDHDKTF